MLTVVVVVEGACREGERSSHAQCPSSSSLQLTTLSFIRLLDFAEQTGSGAVKLVWSHLMCDDLDISRQCCLEPKRQATRPSVLAVSNRLASVSRG
jgi:hypothetical protein